MLRTPLKLASFVAIFVHVLSIRLDKGLGPALWCRISFLPLRPAWVNHRGPLNVNFPIEHHNRCLWVERELWARSDALGWIEQIEALWCILGAISPIMEHPFELPYSLVPSSRCLGLFPPTRKLITRCRSFMSRQEWHMINTSVTDETTSKFLSTSNSVCNIILHTKYAQAKWLNCLFKVEKNRYEIKTITDPIPYFNYSYPGSFSPDSNPKLWTSFQDPRLTIRYERDSSETDFRQSKLFNHQWLAKIQIKSNWGST